MSVDACLDWWIAANFSLGVASLGLWLLSRSPRAGSAEAVLRLGRWLIVVALISPVVGLQLVDTITWPAAKKKAAVLKADSSERPGLLVERSVAPPPSRQRRWPLEPRSIALAMFGLGLCFAGIRAARGGSRLRRIIAGAHLVKRRGRLVVAVSDACTVPFAFALPHRAWIILPPDLLGGCPGDLTIVLRHEGAHLRGGDNRDAWLYEIIAALFFVNPALRLWLSSVPMLQEIACDGRLVRTRRVEVEAYLRCLARVAERTLLARKQPVFTTGLLPAVPRQHLLRRMEIMTSLPMEGAPKCSRMILAALTALMTATVGLAASELSPERELTLREAKELVEGSRAKGDRIPLVVNEDVLEHLNRYVGTEGARLYMRESLERMERYEPIIDKKLKKYGMPDELKAVPLIESGYRNLTRDENPIKAAGLWQFMPQTARNFDLEVNRKADERLDPALATDAALRYLKANRLRFKDWGLALLAYNAGETKVQNGIDETGSRDVWKLIEAGYDNDQGYLSKLMAAIIILKNPDLVEK